VSATPTFSDIDRDGALADLLGRLGICTRGRLLSTALAGGALAAALLARPAEAATSDTDVMNFALLLEYLQADFYTEVEQMAPLRGEAKTLARVVGAHERAHVRAFHAALGSAAIAKPGFNFQGATETQVAFVKTAVAFEDLAVAAYKGQAPRLRSPALLAAAVSIHSVEARHAAWIRRVAGVAPAARAFDAAQTRAQITRVVSATNFISSTKPKMSGSSSPTFTG
jgi:hypothetical protein